MPELSPIDIALVLGYLALVVAVGLYAGRRERDTRDFFVGGRRVPWVAVLGSIVATEVSAATFLAVPGVGFGENMTYLQFGVGSILARFFVAFVFIGAFYKADCISIYEYLAKRFGRRSQRAGSLLFVLTRLMASAVRLLIAASGVGIILGIPLHLTIPGFVILALLYTGAGGIKAVIWTDCIQAVIFITAGLFCLYWLIQTTGWDAFVAAGQEAGRFEIFRWTPDEGAGAWAWVTDGNTFWIAALFGFLTTTAALGTDQDLTQRMLSAKTAGLAKRGLILSGFIGIPLAAAFLLVGVGLFALSGMPGGEALLGIERADDAFPVFIAELAPVGLRGLLLAGVLAAAMSSLDSAMSALSSSAVKDLIEPALGREVTPKRMVWVSRGVMLVFALILGVMSWMLREGGAFLWLAFKITSITYGALLGMFLLGLTTDRGTDRGNMLAAGLGLLCPVVLLWLIEAGHIPLAWVWLIVLGTLVTFGTGILFNQAHHDNLSAPQETHP